MGGTNIKLTKEIIKKLNRDTSKGFLYYGKILGSDIYMSIRPHGGKQGNSLYFAVDDSGGKFRGFGPLATAKS